MTLTFVPPRRQSVWVWPAVVNLTLVGAGAGYFIVAILVSALDDTFRSAAVRSPLLLVAPALTLFGVLALMLEVGRPARAAWVLVNLRESWMSREALATASFLAVSAIAGLGGHPAWRTLGSVAAGLVVLSQGSMLRQARAVPAWNQPIIPLLFLASALATGAGVVMIVAAVAGLPVGVAAIVVVTGCLVADAAIWMAYLHGTSDVAFRRATSPLRAWWRILSYVGLARVMPAALLIAVAVSSEGRASARAEAFSLMTLAAGCFALAGGLLLKNDVVRTAGSLRGIALQLRTNGPNETIMGETGQ